MKQAFSEFQPSLHAARESFSSIASAIAQSNALENMLNSRAQLASAQAIQVSLMAKVLLGSELKVNALRLKNHSDLSPQLAGILCRILSQNECAASDWNH